MLQKQNGVKDISKYSETSEATLGAPSIEIRSEQELWSTSLDLTNRKKIKLSLIEKEQWLTKSDMTNYSEDKQSQEMVFIPLPQEEKEILFDTRADALYSTAFLTDIWAVVKSNAFFKTCCATIFFLFGSITLLFKYYLLMTGFCIFTGIMYDIKGRKFTLLRFNKALGQQIYMLIAISGVYAFSHVLINEGIFGNKAVYIKDALVIWFFVINSISTFKYLLNLGVPFPDSWKEKSKVIKTILD